MQGRLLAAHIAFARPYPDPAELVGAVASLAELAVEAAELLILLRFAIEAPIEKASAIAGQTWAELAERFPCLDSGSDEEGDILDLCEGVDL